METYSLKNQELFCSGKRIFVGYITAGYPDSETFFRLAGDCETAGLDVFEIGFPAANPVADGEIIRHAHKAVAPTIKKDIEFWRRLRNEIKAPIWLMGYAEDLVGSGMYLKLAREGLIDALVVPDITNEERKEMAAEVNPFHVDVLGFINDQEAESEQDDCFENFGIIYQQLYSGPTGMVNTSSEYLKLLKKAQAEYEGVLLGGFGISTGERVEELLTNGFDGVIIGSAIMKRLAESEEKMITFIKEISATAHKAYDMVK